MSKPYNALEGKKPTLSFNLHDGSDERISIVVVHKDKPEYLSMCLQSIAVTSVNSNVEIIVVDNNSEKKDSLDYLQGLEDQGIKVVRNNKNLYWSPAVNRGIEAASKGSKYFVLMHCDVVVLASGWLDFLINVSQGNQCGMVGVQLDSYEMQGQKIDFIEDWCVLITRECWNAVGPYNEELPVLGASFLFTMKAQSKQFNPQIIRNDGMVHHYKIMSMKYSDYERWSEKAQRDIPQFIRKLQSESL